jgi:hypothetical protein
MHCSPLVHVLLHAPQLALSFGIHTPPQMIPLPDSPKGRTHGDPSTGGGLMMGGTQMPLLHVYVAAQA